MLEISLLAEKLSGSQEELCSESVELVISAFVCTDEGKRRKAVVKISDLRDKI